MIDIRIKEIRRVQSGDLLPHLKNWRIHSASQRNALKGSLRELGHISPVIVRETPEGLQIIDGHLRADIDEIETIPVIVVDLDDSEAEEVLATLDPLAALAISDQGALDSLQAIIVSQDDHLKGLLHQVNGFEPLEIETFDQTQESVDWKAKELEDKFHTKQQAFPVKCPNCGNEFEVTNI